MKRVEKSYVKLVWEAADGTIFDSEQQCSIYENTCRCAIGAKFKPLIKNTITEYELTGLGTDEYHINFVKLSDTNDLTTLLEVVKLSGGEVDRAVEIARPCVGTDDFVLVGQSDDYYYVIDSANNMLKNIATKLTYRA